MTYLFTADWCNNCNVVKCYIEENNLDIEIVNVDENFDKAELYGVRGLPTLIIIDGEVKQPISGAAKILKFLKGE